MKIRKHWYLAVFLSVVCASSFAADVKTPVPAMSAVVTGTNGQVLLIADNDMSYPERGTQCAAGDELRTRENSHMDIAVDGTACRLLASTRVKLMKTKTETKIMLLEGNGLFDVRALEPGKKFVVETPTALAAVRGTKFWGRSGEMDYLQNGKQTSAFAVLEGEVEVTMKNSKESVVIGAKQAIDVELDGKTYVVRDATSDELNAIRGTSGISMDAKKSSFFGL